MRAAEVWAAKTALATHWESASREEESKVGPARRDSEYAVHVRIFTSYFKILTFTYYYIFIVTLNCGEMSSENCTYFEGRNIMPGGCEAQICPCNNNICQVSISKNIICLICFTLCIVCPAQVRLRNLRHSWTFYTSYR